jgi:hypothetical protein
MSSLGRVSLLDGRVNIWVEKGMGVGAYGLVWDAILVYFGERSRSEGGERGAESSDGPSERTMRMSDWKRGDK